MTIAESKKLIFLVLIALYFSRPLAAADNVSDELVFGILKREGAVTYSHKPNYSKAIVQMYLGYDQDGNMLMGIAYRKYKTYKKVTTLIAIKKEANSYIVSEAMVPDIGIIKEDKKKHKVLSALNDILGTVLITSEGNEQGIDAVSGATRYYNRLYLNYDFLSKNIIQEMKRNPDWPRYRLPENYDK